MIIYPAIDLKDAKCVRLTKGDFNNETIYSRSPLEQAKVFEEKGFNYLHLIDLDRTIDKSKSNLFILLNASSPFLVLIPNSIFTFLPIISWFFIEVRSIFPKFCSIENSLGLDGPIGGMGLGTISSSSSSI